ncbi:MAG: carbohydrate ABC transporter substrate-binding protein [Rhizobiaceae bacterium]|nr:carbohydrate ABC transporter substrate-binding protein [Rhizobiaceae bacterium]
MAGLLLAIGAGSVAAQDRTIVIESWRDYDLPIWQETIIPAFEAGHPGIKVLFQPSTDAGYDSALTQRLDAGTAGDLIACRPSRASLELFDKGHLAGLNDLPELAGFSEFERSAWTTDDGKITFCVPVASVIHGFIYNADAFEQLGVAVPVTEADFFAALEKIKEEGSYVPLALGTKDVWEAGILGYQNIGPTYWKGEEGRLALIAGEQKLTDPQWIAPLATLSRWKDFLGEGFETRAYTESQKLFVSGRAAIYPAGSWEIAGFEAQARFRMGAFPPPVKSAGDDCYITDEADIGLGLNARSANAEAARAFLAWVASPQFAALYTGALTGFFSPNAQPASANDPLSREFLSWRARCRSTSRFTDGVLSRGEPSLAVESWVRSADVINGTETPDDAAEALQKGLAGWYRPAD